MHVSLTCFWTFFSICKTYKVTFSIFFPLIKSIFAKLAIYFYYMSRGEMDFIHARTRVVSWGHKSVLLVTTFLGLHLGDPGYLFINYVDFFIPQSFLFRITISFRITIKVWFTDQFLRLLLLLCWSWKKIGTINLPKIKIILILHPDLIFNLDFIRTVTWYGWLSFIPYLC